MLRNKNLNSTKIKIDIKLQKVFGYQKNVVKEEKVNLNKHATWFIHGPQLLVSYNHFTHEKET